MRHLLLLGLAGLLLLAAACSGGGGGIRKPAIDLSGVAPAAETYGEDDFHHLRYVLTREQLIQLHELPEGDRAAAMRVVWASLDPTPTTEANERKDVHYKRLAYVRRNFAIDESPGWDKRGELLLRYGAPDRRNREAVDVVENVGLLPPRETWVYAWLGQAYRLEDARFQGNFQDSFELERRELTASPRDFAGARDEWEEQADAFPNRVRGPEEFKKELDAEAQIAEQQLLTMFSRGQEAYEERPQAYLHDHGGAKLDYVFDVVNFRGRAGTLTRMEVNTAFWANELKYRKRDDGRYEAVLEAEIVAKTPEYDTVRKRTKLTYDRKDSVENLQGRLVLDQLSIDLVPGNYRLALSVRDSLSRNIGIYQTETVVEEFPPGRLAMSDVQLAFDVKGGKPGDAFLKGNLQVVPYPLGTYPPDRDIHLFFEIYELEASPTGDVLYTVEFLIEPRSVSTVSWFGSSKGRVVPGIATAFDGTGKQGTVREWIILDPSTFDSGVYDVEVRVIDRVGDGSVTRDISFAVRK